MRESHHRVELAHDEENVVAEEKTIERPSPVEPTGFSLHLKLLLAALALILLSLAGTRFWWMHHPVLTVYLGPEIAQRLDKRAYRMPLNEAGVRRIRFLDGLASKDMLGPQPDGVAIALVLSQERNPELDEEMLSRGLTGPGYTDGYTCYVYEPDIKLFLKKHR